MLYKIGEFSRINKISKRMLRYYDEKKLLKPDIDKENGYRYYSIDDIDRIKKIKMLRKYEFTTIEIKEILEMDLDELQIVYKSKADDLYKKTIEYSNMINEMNDYIRGKSLKTKINNIYDVSIGTKKSFYGVCLRKNVDESGLELLLDELSEIVSEMNINLLGKYFAIFYSTSEDTSEKYDVEVCQPISGEFNKDDCRIRFFEEMKYISTIHIGDYSSTNYAYAALYNWADLNKYILKDESIEIYYTDESMVSDSCLFITEICMNWTHALQ